MTRRIRYSRWDGTQTPFPKADDVMSEIADDVLETGDINRALRRLAMRGMSIDGERLPGIRDALERLRRRRDALMRETDPDSSVQEILNRLSEIVETERSETQSRAELGSDVQSRLEALDHLAERPSQALDDFSMWEFLSPEAEAAYRELVDDLRAQAMSNFFSGAEQAMSNTTPEDVRRAREMVADLRELIAKHRAGEPTDLEGFLAKHGQWFDPRPGTVDELIDQLTKRMAAAQAAFNSLSEAQRQRMQEMMESMLADPELAAEMAALSAELSDLLPEASPMNFPGFGEPLDWSQTVDAMRNLRDIDDLSDLLSDADLDRLDGVDDELLKEMLGEDSADALRRLSRAAEQLRESRLVEGRRDRMELTPAGIRKLAEATLRHLFSNAVSDMLGGHADPRREGSSSEETGTVRQIQFGDDFKIDVKASVFEAVRNSGGGSPVKIGPKDFMVRNTEKVVRSATVLCLDRSWSMVLRGSWLAAKQVTLALQALVSGQFPGDELYIVAFADVAERIRPDEIPTLECSDIPGTNTSHALDLSRQLLAAHTGCYRQVILVTDGEPTSHLLDDGTPFFAWPTTYETMRATVNAVGRCTRDGVVINTFAIDPEPGLVRFTEQLAQMNRGRVFHTSADSLGDYVLVDYLRDRRTRLGA